jgi:hypothetical protein
VDFKSYWDTTTVTGSRVEDPKATVITLGELVDGSLEKIRTVQQNQDQLEKRISVLEYQPRGLGGSKFEQIQQEEFGDIPSDSIRLIELETEVKQLKELVAKLIQSS